MNLRLIVVLITLMLIGILQSCGGDKVERPDAILTPEQRQAKAAQFDAPVVPNTPVASSTGVMHYICPNGHPGSNAQGACSTCGQTLQHNQAFHNQQPNPNAAPNESEPPQNALGVWHYTCPNGHAGGSGSATPCPECGTTLVHNTAYHDGAAGTPALTATPGAAGAGAAAANQNISVTPPPPPPPPGAPEPAQNAQGVWHYTCPNGHEGGAGSAVACGECGTTMVHNQAYH